jgi:hypothetical protein
MSPAVTIIIIMHYGELSLVDFKLTRDHAKIDKHASYCEHTPQHFVSFWPREKEHSKLAYLITTTTCALDFYEVIA